MKTSVLLLLIILISCSTPYQPQNALGGYSSYKIEENTFRVQFKGNQHTKAEKVFEYLERRCAEITIKNGYDYFMVVEDSSHINKAEFENKATLDEQLEEFQDPERNDNYLLDRKPVITRDKIKVILRDRHLKIPRTYSYYFIDNQATDVVGVFKIILADEIIENLKEYYHHAAKILEKYKN